MANAIRQPWPRHLYSFARIVQHPGLTPLFVALSLNAIWTMNRRYHMAFVAFALIYRIVWILRLFGQIG